MSATVDVSTANGDPVVSLGVHLKEARLQAGLALREVARQLSVSPSFVSQIENGKSQPSVATLYALATLLGVSIDALFQIQSGTAGFAPGDQGLDGETPINRSDFGQPMDAWQREGSDARIVVVRPIDRPRLIMDSGVVWEQLASNRSRDLDFMDIEYPPGSSSTSDGSMLRHDGMEYGLIISGELTVTYGFDTYLLKPGDSVCFEPHIPHVFTNKGTVPARGVWVVRNYVSERPAQ